MNEINVTAKADKVWKKDYGVFRRSFLGTSKNGESCIILNEFVLSFENKPKFRPYQCERIYRKAIKTKRSFAYWKNQQVLKRINRSNLKLFHFDGCMYGLKSFLRILVMLNWMKQ